jgi:hypothetical protein
MSNSRKITSYRKRLSRVATLAMTAAVGAGVFAASTSGAETVKFDITIARASRSGNAIDKRLAFAKKGLLGYGYTNFTYIRNYSFALAEGKEQKFSVGQGISAELKLQGLIEKSERVQYSLTFHAGKKNAPRINWSVSRNGEPGINALRQSGDWAYMIIVRALK